MATELKSRAEIEESLKWDLSLMYKTEADLQADLDKMQEMAAEIADIYKGKLDQADSILACVDQVERVTEIVNRAQNYALLGVEADHTDSALSNQASRVSGICAKVLSTLSFVESEICEQSDEVLAETIGKATRTKYYLKRILEEKPHKLHPEAERVIAALAPALDSPYEIYGTIKMADIAFDDFEVDGKSYPLGYAMFENFYEYEPDTPVRRAAFDAFSKELRKYENGTAAVYNTQLQKDKIMSELRHFDSLEAKDLFIDRVSKEMYDRQIDLITTKLAPHMRRYAKLLQKIYKLDKMTYADLKLPLDPEYIPKVTIEEAEKIISNGLSVMGEEYVGMVHEAFKNRWIDFADNYGKCTGGFCESPYGTPSFILMNWHGKMSDVLTLAHELGHAGHFRLCNNTQSVFDIDVSKYIVEAPSTMNELLLAHYLLKTNDDKRFRRWVLSCMVGNTYYHDFVTHLLEGAYQREVYKVIDAGGSVQAETLDGIFRDVLEKFWGDDVEITPGAELTWMRQPHYYSGLYSYSYSSSLTIATQMCKRIEAEGEPAVEDWKNVLRAGATKTPMELAALGGIDISTDAALLDTIDIIGKYIDEIYELTEELALD